jgi:hypothetical protein
MRDVTESHCSAREILRSSGFRADGVTAAAPPDHVLVFCSGLSPAVDRVLPCLEAQGERLCLSVRLSMTCLSETLQRFRMKALQASEAGGSASSNTAEGTTDNNITEAGSRHAAGER